MLADVPHMTWFADIKLLLWRFLDKMDGKWCAPWSLRAVDLGLQDSCPALLFPVSKTRP